MSKMLERAARALREHVGGDATGLPWDDAAKQHYEACARAVLMAVREPGSSVLEAVFNAADDYPEVGPSGIWESGIDAILNDGGDQ